MTGRAPRLRAVALFFLGLTLSGPLFAQSQITAEQERLALVAAIQKRLPDTGPTDWAQGIYVLTQKSGGVQVVPFNAENATNTADILAIGKKAWDRKFKNGKSLASCFPNGGKRVAATYPQYDTKTKRVVTLEIAINRCLQLHGEAEIDLSTSQLIGPLVAYARSLAQAQRVTVRVASVAAKEKFDSGKSLFSRRIGQRDLACASCHVLNAGNSAKDTQIAGMRAHEVGTSPAVGQATSWPKLEPGDRVRTLQMQFQHCMKRAEAEPFELGSEEFNDLEYFLTFVSNGLPIRSISVYR